MDIRKFFQNKGRGRGTVRRNEEEDEGGIIIAHINGNINIYAGNRQCCQWFKDKLKYVCCICK